MKSLFIFGTAGHARDMAEVAAALGYRPVFVAHDSTEHNLWRSDDEIALESEVVAMRGEHFAIGVGDNRKRAAIASRYCDFLRFPSLIHPDTTLARGIAEALSEARGTVLFPGVRVMGHCRIGRFCTLNLNATVSHDCQIGDFATLAPGSHMAGNVHLGEGAWLGMGAVVNQGGAGHPRRIGAWAMIGSGAVVLNDVPERTTQVGVPAREAS
jgi:sugar O-acyltransferase (sialic acid O-acetyltransferase NeuD family)